MPRRSAGNAGTASDPLGLRFHHIVTDGTASTTIAPQPASINADDITYYDASRFPGEPADGVNDAISIGWGRQLPAWSALFVMTFKVFAPAGLTTTIDSIILEIWTGIAQPKNRPQLHPREPLRSWPHSRRKRGSRSFACWSNMLATG